MPEQQLNQTAIDSLFTQARPVEVIEIVNFADRKGITAEQMAMLVSLNQAFSRSLSIKLSAWLGANIRMAMVAAERCLYTNLLEGIVIEETYFGQCRFFSPDCRALMAMDLALTEPVVNLGLGGPSEGEGKDAKREITAIDTAIINVLLTTVCTEMNQMWAAYKLHTEYEFEVPPANAARVFPQMENVLSFTYEMSIGSLQGTFQIAFATAVSDVILRELDRQELRRVQLPATRSIIEQRLGEVTQPASLRLPTFKLRAADLIDLQPGSILKSNVPRTSWFRFSVPGGPAWDATAVVIDSRIGARIERPRTSETATGSGDQDAPLAALTTSHPPPQLVASN